MMTFKTIRASLFASALGLAAFASQTAPAAAQDAFLGTVTAFPYTFCPRGWAEADGRLLAISSNTALFSLLGTAYGGDGRTTFGLPDMRGRMSVGDGTGPGLPMVRRGQKSGAATHTLSVAEMPAHNHQMRAVQAEGNRGRPNSDFVAAGTELMFSDGPADVVMAPGMIGMNGGSQSFEVQPPSIAMRWCVATVGIFPPRS